MNILWLIFSFLTLFLLARTVEYRYIEQCGEMPAVGDKRTASFFAFRKVFTAFDEMGRWLEYVNVVQVYTGEKDGWINAKFVGRNA